MSSRVKSMELQPARLEIRHQIPGRIRLHLPGLRDDPLLSSRLTQALEQVEGVRGVRWNPACASLLLWHRRAGRLTEEELSEILHPLLQPAGSDWPARIAANGVAPEASPVLKPPARTPSTRLVSAQTQVIRTPHWRAWLPLINSWRQQSAAEVERAATSGQSQPGCRLCQFKLTVARWLFNDIWRCWTHELTTQQRSQAR